MATTGPCNGPPVSAAILLGVSICTLATLPGCGTVKMSGTARTGTEQLLLTNAWDSALAKVDFRPLAGVPVYLDATNVAAVDQGWVVSSLHQAMLTQGVLLRTKPEQAQWIVEARVGAYGTDAYSCACGSASDHRAANLAGSARRDGPRAIAVEEEPPRRHRQACPVRL